MSTPGTGRVSPGDIDYIHGKLVIISGALSLSPLIYAFIILFLSRSMTDPPLLAEPLLAWALVAAGLIAVVAAFAVRSMLLDPLRLSGRISTAPPPPGRPAAYTPIITAQIIPMAAAESAGVMGVMLFFLTRDLTAALLLCGVSLAGMVFLFPRRSSLAELLDRLAVMDPGGPV